VGTIQCSITDGQTLLSDGAGMDAWQSVGLNLMVSLPHNGQDGIVNVLYSPTVAAYLKQYWMGNFSLWCRGVINLIEDAMSMQIEANNQFSEALMKNVKYNQDVQSHLSEPADYILHHHEDLEKSMKQFIHQYKTIHGQIQELLDKICMMMTRLACNQAIESSYWRMDNNSDVGLLMGYVLYRLPIELEFMDLDTFSH
jgi:hypothetical protein